MRRPELPSLTGLRFCAAFAILFEHTLTWCTPFNDTASFHTAAALVGLPGMPLFFVLSGFVIHYNYGSLFRERSFPAASRDFLAARFARLYPLYFFFFVFGAVGDFTVNWIPDTPGNFVSYILHAATLTQSWVYEIVVNRRLLLDNGFGLGWSVSTEFFFYLAYLVLVFAVPKIRRPASGVIAIAVYAAAVLGALWFVFLHVDALMSVARAHLSDFISKKENFSNSFYRYLFYYSPYVRIWEFLLGCLCAQLFLLLRNRPVTDREQRAGAIVLGAALVAFGAFAIVYAFGLGNANVYATVHFFALNFGCAVPIAAIIFCTARYSSPLARLLSSAWMIWLGEISYSIYAVHTWTLRPLIRPAVNFNWFYGIDAVLRIALGIGFTVIVATATYAIIEAPGRRYLRAKLMRQPKTSTASESAPEPAQ